MHELAITEQILKLAVEKANDAGAKKVTRVSLVVGELSGVAPECVQFYFEFLRHDSIAGEATLSFAPVAARLRCRDCAAEFSPEAIWVCPKCQGRNISIAAGRECHLESIEV
ncbi:MAG: hydrogenase maturation nickel metallochaperone HypA, partial [Chloroflexota bacterium]